MLRSFEGGTVSFQLADKHTCLNQRQVLFCRSSHPQSVHTSCVMNHEKVHINHQCPHSKVDEIKEKETMVLRVSLSLDGFEVGFPFVLVS